MIIGDRSPGPSSTATRPGSRNNVFTILQQASAIGVVTVGMTFVIIGGGIDLSVGAIIALAGVWAHHAGHAELRRRPA